MKKVLKLIVLVAVMASLTLVAFASSPELQEIPDESGSPELVEILAEIPDGLDIKVVPPTENAANEAAALAADPDATILSSFDIVVTRTATGEGVHTGPIVTITINCGPEYEGYTLKLYETSEGQTALYASAVVPASGVVVFTIDSFSNYTPVLVKPVTVEPTPVTPGPVTPQTMQTLLPIALVVLAAAAAVVAVIAKKRSFN